MSRPAPPDDPRPALRAGFATVAVLVFGLGGWGGFAAVDGAVLAAGRIEAGRERLVLQHPEGGAVAEVFVAEGDEVAAGARLMRLDDRALQGEIALVGQLLAEVHARIARFEAERDETTAGHDPGTTGAGEGNAGALAFGSPIPALAGTATESASEAQTELLALRRAAFAHQIGQIDSRLAQITAEAEGLETRRRAQARESAHLREELNQQEALHALGLSPLPRVLALRRDEARLAGAEAMLRAEAELLGQRSREGREQRAALIAGRRAEAEAALGELAPRRLELEARLASAEERRARLEIRAPAAGRIHALALTSPGSVLRPAEPLAEIIPSGVLPLIAARLRPEDIDRLHEGQAARVLLPATGGRAGPELPARIARLSADSYHDPQGGPPYFRAELELRPEAASLAADRVLLPGMPVELRITTGTRSPLSWLFAPLTRYFGRAFRED